MIRYRVTVLELMKRIESQAPGWLEKARNWTDKARKVKKFVEGGPPWRDVKSVFTELQSSKCLYCERCLPRAPISDVERDVEHYRPKKAVHSWPPAASKRDLGLISGFPLGSASAEGYYLLAHNVLNYGASCKTCNSSLKGDRFPIAGPRRTQEDDVRKLRAEKPYLLFPIGDYADTDDPEDLIGFLGTTPIVKVANGHAHRRALVTIGFFQLDRDDLQRERAHVLTTLWEAYEDLQRHRSKKRRMVAKLKIDHLLSGKWHHTSCARAYYALLQTDRAQAEQYYDLSVRMAFR
ncbi:MAG: hypothetical protein HY303_22325 [Candidatus Wallbacteria bacterium]|nr:hypothetical protein [Candidatus Wallbacteria bacterium]